MAKLILKEFRCVEESDEIDSDSPYFVVFVGKSGTNPTSDVKMIRREAWDNDTDTGELKVANITVADGVNANTVVLAALMEEDGDANITGARLAIVKSWMQAVFSAFNASGSASADDLATKIRPEFAKAINANKGDDEMLGIRRVPVPSSPGNVPLLTYTGDESNYRVRFTVA